MYTYEDYREENCTFEQYINQYNPIKLELGKTYMQESAKWAVMHFKIIFIDNTIAVGIITYDGITCKNIVDSKRYCMFFASNGFKYGDVWMPEYRLIAEVS